MSEQKPTDEDHGPKGGMVPTLQQICETVSIRHMLEGNFDDSEFSTLEPRLQQILFKKVSTELGRLTTKLDEIEACCPYLDLQVHRGSRRYEQGQDDDDRREPSPYEKMRTLSQNWKYDIQNRNTRHDPRDKRYTTWGPFQLLAKSHDEDMIVGQYGDENYNNVDYHRAPLYNRISSQLLLYRLCIMFGMPPPVELDGYKVCWNVTLLHSDGESVLSFGDWKGSASANFSGKRATSEEALKLLNFVTSYNMLHTYDGVIAGAQA